MGKAGVAAAVVAGLLFTPSAASAQLCIVGIFAKAIYASVHEDRELTQKEAMTCGLLKDDDDGKPAAKDKAKKKKVAGAAKNKNKKN